MQKNLKNIKRRCKMPEKHCKNCKHSRNIESIVTEDFQIIPELNECSNAHVTIKFMESHNWKESELAKNCEHYEPKPVGNCSNCDYYIATPIPQWSMFVKALYGEVPVCSEKCKKELESKIENYNKEKNNNC
jgi:hypothetical protein